jgi:hypothetical protein
VTGTVTDQSSAAIPGATVTLTNVATAKRIRIVENHTLMFRADIQNLTNTPVFSFPTATINSTLFGRIRDGVQNSARRVQFALKYNF